MKLHVRRWALRLLPLALVAYACSGFYFVNPDSRGVVRWFGRVPPNFRKVPPGLHYAPPWPLCRVDRPTTTEVRRVYVGLAPEQRVAIAQNDAAAQRGTLASDMLTGDTNILKTTMVVQYQVIEPADFLFGAADPEALIRATVQAVLIETLAGMPVDQSLTGGKTSLQNETLARSQRRLDGYGCGVQLVSASIETIDPPRAIIAAFQDVVSAKKDGESAVDRANAEASRILSRARGEASKRNEAAEAYKQTRLSRARGEAARFLSVLSEYRRSPEVYRERLWLQTLETVLPKIRTYIVDQKPGDPPTHVRIVESG